MELGARLGPSPRCPLQFRPARARWGAPVSAKFQNAPHCLRVEFGKRRGFWRDPCAFGGLARTFCGRQLYPGQKTASPKTPGQKTVYSSWRYMFLDAGRHRKVARRKHRYRKRIHIVVSATCSWAREDNFALSNNLYELGRGRAYTYYS